MMKLLNRINNVLLQMTYSLLVKSQKAASQIVTIVCVLFLIGCDNDNSNNSVAPERARLIKITPAVSEIERFAPEMELVFDKPVAQVEVNGVDADPNQTMSVGAWQSTTVWTLDLSLFDKIHPPTHPLSTYPLSLSTHPLSTDSLPKEQVCFTVSYVDETGIYQEDLDCVELPLIDRGYIQPRIIEGTVKDGDVGVDVDKLHAYGFTFRFNEVLTGYLEIRSESSGEDLCWIVEWSKDGFGESVKLSRRPQKGQRLLPGMVYIIIFEVSDAGGNALETYRITFTTKA